MTLYRKYSGALSFENACQAKYPEDARLNKALHDASVMHTVTVIAVLVLAPTGAVLISNLGPLWLKIEEKSPVAQPEEEAVPGPPPATPRRRQDSHLDSKDEEVCLEMARRLYTGQVFFFFSASHRAERRKVRERLEIPPAGPHRVGRLLRRGRARSALPCTFSSSLGDSASISAMRLLALLQVLLAAAAVMAATGHLRQPVRGDAFSISAESAPAENAPPDKQPPAATAQPSYTPFDMTSSKGVASISGGALGAVFAAVAVVGAGGGLG